MLKPFTLYLISGNKALTWPKKDFWVGIIDGECCSTEAEFHNEVSNQFNFPEYYGKNLDALFDCLLDLSWIREKNIVLQFNNFEKILSGETRKDYFLSTLLMVIGDICFNDPDITQDPEAKQLFVCINDNIAVRELLSELEINYESHKE